MTTAPIDSRGSVDIAPQLRGIELTLVGVTVDRRLVDLDLASGLGRVRAPDGLAFEVGRLYAGRDWVGISTVSGTDLLVVGDDDSYHAITIADPWGLIYDRTTGRFWTDTQRGGRSREVQEVDTFGDPTGRSVTIPGRDWPIGADQGALVVQAPGMVYRVTPEDSELLARGELIGLSERVAVVFACDASFDCGMSAIDRETGVTRPVPIEPDDPDTIGDGIVGMWSFGLGVNGSVSPDGRRVVGGRADRSRVDFGVLDLDTGEFVVLPGSGFVSSAMWTPDGKYLLYASAGRLRAFDTRSGEAFAVLVEPERWLAVTARPSSPVGADAR